MVQAVPPVPHTSIASRLAERPSRPRSSVPLTSQRASHLSSPSTASWGSPLPARTRAK
ncbi:hypothetical protein IEO21_08353 [Rhodonia placenta]|uniref:Uncharacterized protein n=1 Tax=Rhodonia placenta TaxID=104341 RepID=A0A8H7NWL1_9APHY|nr:hypothetical protein IEO21_08353 [Postia placenta]